MDIEITRKCPKCGKVCSGTVRQQVRAKNDLWKCSCCEKQSIIIL